MAVINRVSPAPLCPSSGQRPCKCHQATDQAVGAWEWTRVESSQRLHDSPAPRATPHLLARKKARPLPSSTPHDWLTGSQQVSTPTPIGSLPRQSQAARFGSVGGEDVGGRWSGSTIRGRGGRGGCSGSVPDLGKFPLPVTDPEDIRPSPAPGWC